MQSRAGVGVRPTGSGDRSHGSRAERRGLSPLPSRMESGTGASAFSAAYQQCRRLLVECSEVINGRVYSRVGGPSAQPAEADVAGRAGMLYRGEIAQIRSVISRLRS
jgi:hypothetical protein